MSQKKDIKYQDFISLSGVGERVRSPAPLTRPSSLANCLLHHMGTPTYLIDIYFNSCKGFLFLLFTSTLTV